MDFSDEKVSDGLLKIEVFDDYNDEEPAKTHSLHINSSILAEKSSYFEKLFTGGFMESVQASVTIKILREEEEPFNKLLKSMYSDVLPSETSLSLLKIIVLADKFQVPSSLSRCSQLLQSRMCMDLAMLCLGIQNAFSSNPLACEYMQPVFDSAIKLVLEELKEVDIHEAEILDLPLSGLEIVLSSDNLEPKTEYDVFNLTLSWVKNNFEEVEESRDILKRLLSHVRFPMMNSTDLRVILECTELGHSMAHDIVLDALFAKVERDNRFLPRAYKVRPVKMLEVDSPYPFATIYWDMTLDQAMKMYPNGEAKSEKFCFRQDVVEVYAKCTLEKKTSGSGHVFGMLAKMTSSTTGSCVIEYEFACRTKPSQEFELLMKNRYTWRKTEENQEIKVGKYKMIAWDELIREESPYFINGVLYFRIGLRVKKKPEGGNIPRGDCD